MYRMCIWFESAKKKLPSQDDPHPPKMRLSHTVYACLLLPLASSAHVAKSGDSVFARRYGFGGAPGDAALLSRPDPSPGLRRRLEGGKPRLHASVDTIQGHLQPITVTWTDVEYTSAYDWIGVWPSTDHYTLFEAPLKFKFVCEECQNSSIVPPVFPPVNGSVDFIMQNYRKDLVFIYVHGTSQYPESIARSQIVTVANPQLPRGGHLSFLHGADGRVDHSRMRTRWSSAPVDKPVVRWGCNRANTPYGATNPPNVP